MKYFKNVFTRKKIRTYNASLDYILKTICTSLRAKHLVVFKKNLVCFREIKVCLFEFKIQDLHILKVKNFKITLNYYIKLFPI